MGAEFQINIQVNPGGAEQGAQRAGRALDEVKGKAEGAGEAIKKALEFYAVEEAVRELVHLGDEYTTVRNKLVNLASDQANLTGLMDATFAAAQRSRTGWEDFTSTFQRLSNASKGLGLSQQETLNLTEELAKGMKLSGATTNEATMSMNELAHAFATGTMTSREFRVLMKDAPAFMHELQVASGHTTAEFTEMAHQGKITGTELVKWIGDAADSIDSKFANLTPTVAGSLTMLHNAAVRFFGEAGTGSGVLRTLSGVIIGLAQNFETIGKLALAAGQVIGVYFAVQAVGKAIEMLYALGAAALANPFTALLYALVALVAVLRQFGDQMNAGLGSAVTVRDVINALWEAIKDLGGAILEFISEAWSALTNAFDDGLNGDGIEFNLKNVLLFIASFVDAAIGIFKFLKDSIITIFGGIPLIIAKGFEVTLNSIIDAYNNLKKLTGETFQGAMGNAGQIASDAVADSRYQAALDAASKRGQPIANTEALQRSIEDQTGGRVNRFGGIDHVSLGIPEDVVKQFGTKLKDDFKNDLATDVAKEWVSTLLGKIQHETKDQTAGTVGTDKSTAEARALSEKEIEALKKLQAELDRVRSEANPVEAAILKLAKAQDVLTQSVAAGKISQDEANKVYAQLKERLRDALDPYDAMVRKLGEEAKTSAQTNEQRQISSKLLEIETTLKRQGVEVSKAQREELEKYLQLINLLKDARTAQAEADRKVAEAQDLYLKKQAERDPTVVLKKELTSLQDEMMNIGKDFKKLVDDFVGGVDTMIGDFITKGTADWNAFFKKIIDDISKMAIHGLIGQLMELVNPTTAVMPAVTMKTAMIEAGATTAGTLGAAITSAGEVVAGMWSAAIQSKGAVDAISSVGAVIPGHATGADFTVGGGGGLDSTLVAFRATPGERVQVTPQGMQSNNSGGGGAVVNLKNITVSDARAAAIGAVDSRMNERVIQNVIRKNPGLIRGVTGHRY